MKLKWFPLIIGVIMLSLMLVSVVSASYPMFHYDTQRMGYIPQDGPLTNATLWVAETAEYADGSPAVHNGKVFVPTWPDMDFTDNDPMGLVCYDAATGTELWTNELGGTSVGSVSGVAVADGRVYLGGTDGRLYCIDEETGKTFWASDQIDATGYFGLSSSPLIYEGTAYALSASDGVLHAFTPEGIASWSFPTGGAVGYFTSPAAADGKVFVAGNESDLFCIDTTTHTATWSVALPTAVKSTPAIGDGKVYVTTAERLYALDGSTGAEVWNASLGGASSTPAVAGETVIAGSSDGLHAYDAGTGTPLWNFPSARVDVSPIVAGNLVYAATNEETGTAYAVDTGTGEEVWSYTIEAPGDGTFAAFFASSPAVSDGVLYIGAENNRFYAFGEGSVSPTPTPTSTPTSTPTPTPTPAPGSWNGTVILAEETFTFTPSNNASATYTVNRTTDLGALTLAAQAGGFTFNASDAWYASYGSFMLEDIAGIANEDWTQENARFWSIFINGAAAPAGLGANTLADGDRLAFYYCPSDPDTYAPLIDQAGYVVIIDVNVRDFTWEGAVSLTDGQTFTVTPFNNASETYTFNRTSALGALDAAATAGGFNYTVQETTWGPFLYSIGGIAYNETSWDSWIYSVNGVTADVGAADYQLTDGGVVTYWYGAWGSTPDTAGAVVNITVSIPATPAPTPTPGGGGGGGDSPPSRITVTLQPGTFNITAENSGKTHTVNRQTALGALDATGIAYTIDDSYYQEYGSLFLNSIRGRASEGMRGWMYQVNGGSPAVGANAYTVTSGDEVVFFWSESMSSTPATSPDVVSIKVVIPASSGGSDSGSSGGGGSGSVPSSTTGEQPNSGEDGSASFIFGLPAGATIEIGEWGQTFSINTGPASAGEEVTVSGNTLTINQSGIVLTIAAKNIDEKDGTASGLIESVTAAITPISREIEGVGVVAASLDLNLTGIPAADGRLDIAFNATPDAAAGNAFTLAAAETGDEITALAYTMTVTRTNLENGEDIAGAVIRMSVSPEWVEEHGGADAVRIVRSAEDGTHEILETHLAGTDTNGNLIFEATSPGGLSTFGLLAVRAAPEVQETPAVTATTPVSGTPAAAGTLAGAPPSLSSPFIAVGVGAALLIGAAYLIIRWRRER
ncbi:DUF4430 domain-containing protein [Methanoculleus sp. Afa-1]|uniref:DUF4430 domain-containing protein n=2 Tax=Methanoculleus formosensis TaxID=2590886 RepID=A0A9E5DC89_9EURY|nr:DUF4430 domain-containing protein [Methanoculleus sp. Afa-1]